MHHTARFRTFKPLLPLLPIALAAFATCAHAAGGSIETFPPPADGITGLSSGGSVAVASGADGIYVLDASRTATVISANSTYWGYYGTQSISADGSTVAASVTGSDGYGQAGIYDVNKGGWTALGGFGNGAYNTSDSINQSSYVSGMSADGSTVVGAAAYSATANTATGTFHAAVWRNGQVYDLNGTSSGNGSGNIVTSSANGNAVAGYTNNNDRDSYRVWTWNGTNYGAGAAVTGTNPYTGVVANVQVDALSANGVWGAGNSSRNRGPASYGPFGNAITFLPATLYNSTTGVTTIIPFDHAIDYTNPSSMYNDIDKNAIASIAGVTDNGTVFGTFTYCIDSHCNVGVTNDDSFVYLASTGQSITVDSYLQEMGAGLSATQHVDAIYGVSADGTAISGTYFDTATNTTSSFIAHIDPTAAVPEPGSWALLALGLPLLITRRLRQRREQ